MENLMNFEKRILADGQATLYRGDSLELLRAGVFGKLGAIVSDPPYGIGYQHSGGGAGVTTAARGELSKSKTWKIHGDDQPFDPSPWLDTAPVSRTDNPNNANVPLIVFWGADNYMQRLPTGGTLLAWDKHIGRGADDSFADCEWAWCGRKTKREVFRWLWKGVATQKHQDDATKDNGHFHRVHVSQKPVELMRWCIDKVRPLAGLPILDPYMGSGSTAIAALSLGHSFVGCEIDPQHFEVACKRVEAYWQRTHADEELMPLFA